MIVKRQFFVTGLLCLMGLVLVFNCSPEKENTALNNMDRKTRIRLLQYLTQGKQLYLQYCANCHMEDGNGYKQLYPPLWGDYVMEDIERTVCISKYGLQGEITVNGATYNLPMPHNLHLSDLEIAEIVTYVYNEFNDTTMIVERKEVSKILQECEMEVVY